MQKNKELKEGTVEHITVTVQLTVCVQKGWVSPAECMAVWLTLLKAGRTKSPSLAFPSTLGLKNQCRNMQICVM